MNLVSKYSSAGLCLFASFFALSCASASAAAVTYSTSAVFSGPEKSGSGLTSGEAIITFTGITSTTVTAPTDISLGFITVTVIGGVTAEQLGVPNPLPTFAGDSFALTLSQSAPSTGSGFVSSTIDGTVTGNSNGIVLTLAPSGFRIGTASYTVQTVNDLVAPNTGGGVTSLQGYVATAPEPSTLGLAGLGLIGMGLAAQKALGDGVGVRVVC